MWMQLCVMQHSGVGDSHAAVLAVCRCNRRGSLHSYLVFLGVMHLCQSTHVMCVGNQRWKGLTWGMLPLLGGAMAACTYHFFYNPPELDFLVAVQVLKSNDC